MPVIIRSMANVIFGVACALAALLLIVALANLVSSPAGYLVFNVSHALETAIPALVVLVLGGLIRYALLKLIHVDFVHKGPDSLQL
jgi:hypothetical protein